MRKLYVPLTIAGIGGLAAFLLSESGQGAVRWLARYLRWNSQGLLEWNEAADAELQRIQSALAALAESIQPRTQPGR
jgi:hypothetical protein